MKNVFSLLVALAILPAALISCKKSSPNLAGFWEGAIEVRDVHLRLVLKIVKAADGSYTATMDSVDQGARDIPVTSITFTNPAVRVEMKPINGIFQGNLNRSASEMAGTWQQGGLKRPLVLKRTDKPSMIAQAKDPAKAYAARKDSDLQGYWKGTLTVPVPQAAAARQAVELRLILKISEAADGTFTGAMDSVDQGAKDIPISVILFNNPALRLEVDGIGGLFEGDLSKDGAEIAGKWTQRERSLPLTFKRYDPSTEPKETERSYVSREGSDLQGIWNGTLDVNGVKLRLALKISEAADGTLSGAMDSLDQGARDLPVTSMKYANPSLRVELRGLGAAYEGQLNKAERKLTGHWAQLGRTNALTFQRSD
jgi:hypothetical protein